MGAPLLGRPLPLPPSDVSPASFVIMAAWSLPLQDAVGVRAISRAAGHAVSLLDWLSLLRCHFHHPPAQVISMLRGYFCMARTQPLPSYSGAGVALADSDAAGSGLPLP